MHEYIFSSQRQYVQLRLLFESIAAIVLSLLFWLWALAITLEGEYEAGLLLQASYDDGLVCFPFVFACGIFGMLVLKLRIFEQSFALSCSIAASFLFTVLVYLMSASLTNPSRRHLAYLIISAVLWILYGIFYYRDAELYRRCVVEVFTDNKLSTHLLEDNV